MVGQQLCNILFIISLICQVGSNKRKIQNNQTHYAQKYFKKFLFGGGVTFLNQPVLVDICVEMFSIFWNF